MALTIIGSYHLTKMPNRFIDRIERVTGGLVNPSQMNFKYTMTSFCGRKRNGREISVLTV